MHPAPPWLKLRGLDFSRRGRKILQDISLDIAPGELILLTGQNGSGKTTLLRILSGLLRPDRVELIQPNGLAGHWRRSSAFLRRSTCYLHQQPYLFDGSVYDNLAYGLKHRGMERSALRERVTAALRATDLEHLSYRHSGELSGGEKQRVAMVRAWILAPRLMLLDEPVANMDKPSRRQGLALINQMRQDQIAVVVTSHDPQHGELSITRHLHLYMGKMIEKGTPTGAGTQLEDSGVNPSDSTPTR